MSQGIPVAAQLATTIGTQTPSAQSGLHFGAGIFVLRRADQVDPKKGNVPGQKVLWYKPSDPSLSVTGRRIDGNAPPLGYDISVDPRPSGPIQPSGVYFPTPGCWEIEAKAGKAELRLVVLVKPAPPTSR